LQKKVDKTLAEASALEIIVQFSTHNNFMVCPENLNQNAIKPLTMHATPAGEKRNALKKKAMQKVRAMKVYALRII
jgi:hypothetical protein